MSDTDVTEDELRLWGSYAAHGSDLPPRDTRRLIQSLRATRDEVRYLKRIAESYQATAMARRDDINHLLDQLGDMHTQCAIWCVAEHENGDPCYKQRPQLHDDDMCSACSLLTAKGNAWMREGARIQYEGHATKRVTP